MLTEEQAAQAARDRLGDFLSDSADRTLPWDLQCEPGGRLLVYDPAVVGNEGPAVVVWEVAVYGSLGDQPVFCGAFVDARSGDIRFVRSYLATAMDRIIYDNANDDDDTVGSVVRSDGCEAPLENCDVPTGSQYPDPINGYTNGTEYAQADDLWDVVRATYEFYADEHGRASYDDADSAIHVHARACADIFYDCPFENAAWTGDQVLALWLLWDGQGNQIMIGDDFVADDIVAHEFTPGVTQFESGLEYTATHAGALNESFSDIWGELIDQSDSTVGDDSAIVKWKIGEDLPNGAIRDMAYPTTYEDPDRLGSAYWYSGSDIQMYTHTNSGVGNKLCFLLTDGGRFSNYGIEALGVATVADLFYWVQTNWLGQQSDYYDLYFGLREAATALDLSEDDFNNLLTACKAVQIAPQSAFSIQAPDGSYLWDFQNDGDIVAIKSGAKLYTCATSQQLTQTSSAEFIIEFDDEIVARVDSSTGHLYIKGNYSQVANLADDAQVPEFIVVNVTGVAQSLIDSEGNLKYRRSLGATVQAQCP